jgi:hypothetical protein
VQAIDTLYQDRDRVHLEPCWREHGELGISGICVAQNIVMMRNVCLMSNWQLKGKGEGGSLLTKAEILNFAHYC